MEKRYRNKIINITIIIIIITIITTAIIIIITCSAGLAGTQDHTFTRESVNRVLRPVNRYGPLMVISHGKEAGWEGVRGKEVGTERG